MENKKEIIVKMDKNSEIITLETFPASTNEPQTSNALFQTSLIEINQPSSSITKKSSDKSYEEFSMNSGLNKPLHRTFSRSTVDIEKVFSPIKRFNSQTFSTQIQNVESSFIESTGQIIMNPVYSSATLRTSTIEINEKGRVDYTQKIEVNPAESSQQFRPSRIPVASKKRNLPPLVFKDKAQPEELSIQELPDSPETQNFLGNNEYISTDLEFSSDINVIVEEPLNTNNEEGWKIFDIKYILYNLINVLFMTLHILHVVHFVQNFFEIDNRTTHICVIFGSFCGYSVLLNDKPYQKNLKIKEIITSRLLILLHYLVPIVVSVSGFIFIDRRSMKKTINFQSNGTSSIIQPLK